MIDRFWPAFKESILEFIYGPNLLNYLRDQTKQRKLAEETFERNRKLAMTDPTTNALLARIKELEEALTKIAAYDDKWAQKALDDIGSYAAFDEPGSVEIARKALNK